MIFVVIITAVFCGSAIAVLIWERWEHRQWLKQNPPRGAVIFRGNSTRLHPIPSRRLFSLLRSSKAIR